MDIFYANREVEKINSVARFQLINVNDKQKKYDNDRQPQPSNEWFSIHSHRSWTSTKRRPKGRKNLYENVRIYRAMVLISDLLQQQALGFTEIIHIKLNKMNGSSHEISRLHLHLFPAAHRTQHIHTARYCTPLKTIKLQPNAAALFLSSARRLCGSEFVIVVAPRSRSMFGCARFFLSSSHSLVSRSNMVDIGRWSHTHKLIEPHSLSKCRQLTLCLCVMGMVWECDEDKQNEVVHNFSCK